MPNAGDTYTITLKKSHLGWGTYRFTDSRGIVFGEGYIPIPLKYARLYNVYNSNNSGTNPVYNCISSDGYFSQPIKVLAQGSHCSGDIYAKQFAVWGNLKAFGDWYSHVHAKIGDHVKVTWLSPTDIEIEHY